jgi:cell wall-associated NlpC family hydrolase
MTRDDFIGKRWALGAEGPDAFDCWTLTRAAARELYGVALPPLTETVATLRRTSEAADAMLERYDWREIDAARAGAVLALYNFAGRVVHVALCLDERSALNLALGMRSHIVPIATLRGMHASARLYAWTR